MDKTKLKNLLIPVALVGLIGVLSLMMFYPKSKTNPLSKETPTPKVTVANEFEQKPTDNTNNTNGEKFTFQVTSPTNKSTVKTAQVTVVGKTEQDADVFVNEIESKADASGNFKVNYTLEEGENYLIVGANNDSGNYDESELTLTYAP